MNARQSKTGGTRVGEASILEQPNVVTFKDNPATSPWRSLGIRPSLNFTVNYEDNKQIQEAACPGWNMLPRHIEVVSKRFTAQTRKMRFTISALE